MLFSSLRLAAVVTAALSGAGAPSTLARTVRAPQGAHVIVSPRAPMTPLTLARVALVPGYSRQTGLPCNTCHFQFPQLTPFGRQFKLNGYTMTGLTPIQNPHDSTQRRNLALNPISPFSAMFVTSLTRMEKRVSGTQNPTVALPQQASIFLAAGLTPKVGIFAQFTYAATEGTFGIDNVDLRYADHTTLAGKDLLFGVTLHNNPTTQDVFNTAPAWSWPFIGTEGAPSPSSSPMVQGALGQKVAGLGAYSLWNNMLYSEFTLYGSAQQGAAQPADSSAREVLRHVAPYGRVVLLRDLGAGHVSLGAFGMDAKMYVEGVGGPADRFTDVGADIQYESRSSGDRLWILRSAFVHERQQSDAAFESESATLAKRSLNDFRVSATWMPSATFGYTLGGFMTSGTSDALFYAPEPVGGSRTGSPNSSGGIAEVVTNPWQNVRVGLQYTRYFRFNGASGNYDGSGRSAHDNNNLYLYSWIAF